MGFGTEGFKEGRGNAARFLCGEINKSEVESGTTDGFSVGNAAHDVINAESGGSLKSNPAFDPQYVLSEHRAFVVQCRLIEEGPLVPTLKVAKLMLSEVRFPTIPKFKLPPAKPASTSL